MKNHRKQPWARRENVIDEANKSVISEQIKEIGELKVTLEKERKWGEAYRDKTKRLLNALGDVIDTLPNPLTWKNEDMDKIRKAQETYEQIRRNQDDMLKA